MNYRTKFLLGFAQEFPFKITATVLLGFSGALFSGVNTTLLAPVILKITGQDAALKNIPPIIQNLLLPFESLPEKYQFIALLGAVIATICFKNLAGYIGALLSVLLQKGLVNRIREEALKVLFEVDLDYFNKNKIGDISRKVNVEVNRTAGAVTTYISLSNVVFTLVIYAGILIAISWQLTIISVIMASGITLISQLFVRRSKTLGKRVTEVNKKYSVNLLESLNGIRLINAVSSGKREFKKIMDIVYEIEEVAFESRKISAAIGPVNEVSSIVVVIAIVLLARVLLVDSFESLSTILLIYLLALFRMLPFVGKINGIRTNLANSSASVEVVHDFLRRDNKPFMEQGDNYYQPVKNSIRFDNISFAYPGHSSPVVQDITLNIPKGKTLALVGSSGSGKSTLISILARFYDPTKGEVYIDDINLKEFQLDIYRKKVGLVSQDTFLFNDTVWNNIAYAKPDASDSDIIQAVKKANAYGFIEQLPQGWQTQIGDRGVMLSGGQRQRLAIARALVQDPDILLLDEATSALDTVSERLVQEALDDLSRNRTTLVVAHRLSTIRNADQIAVMSKGKVVEIGTHGTLLSKGGEYAKLWTMQFGDTEDMQTGVALSPSGYTEHLSNHVLEVQLSSVMSSLELIVDGVAADPDSQSLLVGEAFNVARSLLKTVKNSEKEIAEFAQVSYQTRTHLNSIIGSLQLILLDDVSEEYDLEENSELAQEAYNAAENLLSLIKDYSVEDKTSIQGKNETS
ncbi:MAG: ATP-binding cassette domain-containing protein [Leptolyngbyaceae cyanobacterium]